MAKTKVVYKDIPEWGSLKGLKVVSKDFLPTPNQLVMRPKLKKVTISLDEDSVVFFKAEAGKLKTSYHRMIRTLLFEYANRMKSHE